MGVIGGTNLNKLQGMGGTPTVTIGSGVAMPGGTVSIEGTNTACTVTLTTGTGLTTGGSLFTVTMADGVTFPNKVRPSVTAYNLNAAGMVTSVYISSQTNNSFTITAGSINLGASTTIVVTCHIIGD